MRCIRVTISGLVQGVGYRYFCYKKATEYGIKGYAKNMYNGNVEVIAQGNKNLIKEFIRDLNIGPHYASVKSTDIEEIECEKEYGEFSIY